MWPRDSAMSAAYSPLSHVLKRCSSSAAVMRLGWPSSRISSAFSGASPAASARLACRTLSAMALRAGPLVEFEECLQHALGILDLRVVADAVEQHRVRLRHELAVARHHVRAGHGVGGAVDHAQRHARLLQHADPALAVGASL